MTHITVCPFLLTFSTVTFGEVEGTVYPKSKGSSTLLRKFECNDGTYIFLKTGKENDLMLSQYWLLPSGGFRVGWENMVQVD